MIEWAVTSSALILVVLILRRLLMGKISLRLQYVLWAFVLARLLLPVSFGETTWSVLNLERVVRGEEAAVRRQEPDQVIPDLPAGIPDDTLDPQLSVVDPDGSFSSELPQIESGAAAAPEVRERNTAERGLVLFWAAGALCLGLWFLWVNVRFARKLRSSRVPLRVENCPRPVYVTGAVPTPCLFGLIHPCIYITEEVAADGMVLRHSLAHELTHYHHKDHVWAVLRGLCLALHWYNPLVWLAASLSQRDGELCCDEATIKRLGEKERAAYGRTLLAVTCQGRTNPVLIATSMTGSGKGIKERIFLLAKHPQTAVYTLVVVVLIAAAAVGCTFTGAENQARADEQTPWAWAQSVTTERLAEENTGFDMELLAQILNELEEGQFTQVPDFAGGRDTWVVNYHATQYPFLLTEEEGAVYLEFGGTTWRIDAPELYQLVLDSGLIPDRDRMDETFYQLLNDWYGTRYPSERWYFQGDQPGQPQEGDILLGPVDYQGGEVYLNESTGEVCVVEVSRYEEGQFRALPDPHTLVLHRGQDGTFQGVLGALERDTGAMTAEDIVLNVALGLLDADVSLRRDGYPLPVGPGTWTWEELFHPVYDGEPEVQALPDYEPIYAEGDYWERWSVEGFSVLYYYSAMEDRWSANTIDVTRTDLYTPRGVRVGDSREQVLAAYPEALTGDYWGQYPEEPDLLAYVAWNPHAPGEISDLSQLEFYEGLGPAILFFFEDDTLCQITLTNMFN